MKPYHHGNLKYLPYPAWRVVVLAWAGKFLGVQFNIGGLPFGSGRAPSWRTWPSQADESLSDVYDRVSGNNA